MYLVLFENKITSQRDWCTCPDEDLSTILLNLVAAGHKNDTAVYTMQLPETERMMIYGLKLAPINCDMGIRPLVKPLGDMDEQMQEAEMDPYAQDEDSCSELPYGDDECEEGCADEEPFCQSGEPCDMESCPEEADCSSAMTPEHFVSKTSKRFSYLDRLTGSLNIGESESYANREEEDIAAMDDTEDSPDSKAEDKVEDDSSFPASDIKLNSLHAKENYMPELANIKYID